MLKKTFFLFVVLCLVGCSEQVEHSEEYTWSLSGISAIWSAIEKDGSPLCSQYLLNVLQTGDLLKVDDIVVDCTSKKGLFFSSLEEVGVSVPYQVFALGDGLRGEGLWEVRDDSTYVCIWESNGGYYPLEDDQFQQFLFDNQIYSHHLLSTLYPFFNSAQNHPYHLGCNGKICDELRGLDYGVYYGHVFYHGSRYDLRFASNLLVLDNRVYDLGYSQWDRSREHLIQQSLWILTDIGIDYAIFKRIKNVIFSKEDIHSSSISVDSFDLETCKIVLGKTP